VADDDAGGAQVTGTTVYSSIPAAISANRPSQASLEQGLEVSAVYDLTVHSRSITLHERDEIQVVGCSTTHPYYGLRFRITGVQPSKRYPKVGHLHATLNRIRRSRSQQ